MKLKEHYVKLRNTRPHIREGEGFAITLEELSDILDCTKQNVRLVLKQLVSVGWIRFASGRGRGNHSELTFLRSAEQVVYDWAMEMAGRGDLAGAFAQLNGLSPHFKTQFWDRLSAQFGFQEVSSEEQQLDILRNVMFVAVRNLDPAFLFLAREFNLVTQIFDCLVKVNPETRAIEPHLVHGWEVDATGRVWTFYLRKGIMFHHGREMTAQDVADTLRRLGDTEVGSPYRWLVEGIADIRVMKQTMLEVTLREPNQLFLHFLAAPPAAIVPSEAWGEMAERFRLLPVGSGPFQVVRNDEQQFVLEAHKAYFQGRPFLDRVEYWRIPREQLSAKDVAKMGMHLNHDRQEKPDDWQEQTLLKKFVQYLTCNLQKEGPLQDARFRKVLQLMLDRERMVKALGGIRARVADGFLRRGALGDDERFLEEKVGRGDAEQVEGEQVGVDLVERKAAHTQQTHAKLNHLQHAKQLLADMNYNGESLKLYTFIREENHQDAKWIQQQCAEVGIPVELTFLPVSEIQQRYYEADLLMKADMVDEHVEFPFVKVLRSENSLIRKCLPADLEAWVDQLLASTLQETNADKRLANMHRIEQRLKDEAAVLFLYQEQYVAIYQPHIQGISKFSTGLIDLKQVWFKR